MAFRLVSSGGNVIEPAMLNVPCSGTIHTGGVVDFSATGGLGVVPATSSSTGTTIFGIAQDYAQGKSGSEVRVVMFNQGQIWEADCCDAAITAQIGLKHVLNTDLELRNTSTDSGAGNVSTAIFKAVAMTGSTSGSGKLIGYFRSSNGTSQPDQTTWA